MPAFARFVKGFLDAMGIERTNVVGTSLGGHVGAFFSCDNPDRVRSLVLVGSVGVIPLGSEAAEAVRTNVKNTTREGIEGKLKFVFAKHEMITDALIDEEVRVNTSPGTAKAFEVLGDYIAEKIDRDNIGDRLAEFARSKPVLLVWGEADQAVPLEIGLKVRDKLENADLVRMPGCGHVCYLEDEVMFNRSVLDFMNGVAERVLRASGLGFASGRSRRRQPCARQDMCPRRNDGGGPSGRRRITDSIAPRRTPGGRPPTGAAAQRIAPGGAN